MSRALSRKRPSGRFVLRIDPGLHSALRQAAGASGTSLNDYCARKLAAPFGNLGALAEATEVVARAAELFGEGLLGVAAFGSWARREQTESSDVDVLVVLERRVPLTRKMYRAWDRTPLTWNGRPVEPHFVHLPAADEAAPGLWAEVALDGVVLFERDLRLSARLVTVRHDIVSGRIVRKLVHGHAYWIEMA